jgi:uncharacterized membrane protein
MFWFLSLFAVLAGLFSGLQLAMGNPILAVIDIACAAALLGVLKDCR